MVTYEIELGPTAANGKVVIVGEDGTRKDISRLLHGLDVSASVGDPTRLTLHSYGAARATLSAAQVTWKHDDCSDCRGHDA